MCPSYNGLGLEYLQRDPCFCQAPSQGGPQQVEREASPLRSQDLHGSDPIPGGSLSPQASARAAFVCGLDRKAGRGKNEDLKAPAADQEQLSSKPAEVQQTPTQVQSALEGQSSKVSSSLLRADRGRTP